MDIKEYSLKNNNSFNTGKQKDTIKEKYDEIKDSQEFKQVQSDYIDMVEKFVDNYSSKSEQELISEMLQLIAKKKAEGTFNPNEIRKLSNIIKPLLNEEQQSKMNNLLKFLD